MEKLEMNDSDKGKLKSFSKAAEVLSVIAKVLLIVAIPFIVIAMVGLPVLFKDVKFEDNSISYKDVASLVIDEDNKKIDVIYEEKVVHTEENAQSIIEAFKKIDQNTGDNIVKYVDCELGILLVTLIISIMILTNLRKLLKNIHDGNTPFIMKNVELLRNIVCLQIVSIIIPVVMTFILSIIFNIELSNLFNYANVFEILVLLCLVYIFKYGCVLQEKSKISLKED